MIVFKRVTKIYTRGREEVVALRDVDLEIRKGEFAVVVGPSGSGKSTLLNLIGGIDFPTSGDVLVANRSTLGLSDADLSLLRREVVGMIFQFFHLLPHLTTKENVAIPLLLKGSSLRSALPLVHEALRLVGLLHRESHWPHELSGGEMQRVAMARALIHRPQILLADEPTGNLDSKMGAEILDLLKNLSSHQGMTVVLVTHSEQATALADRVFRLKDGILS